MARAISGFFFTVSSAKFIPISSNRTNNFKVQFKREQIEFSYL